jgi:EmrB/QacA subfamily drug resistance transporter
MAMADRLPRDLLALIGAILLGVFLVQMDSTMVNIALESLRRDFGADLSTVQWVSAAYLLAMAAVIPVAGWAADRFAARTAWLASLGVFTAGSLLCGIAWSAGSLIAMRVVQGVGGGMMMPLFQTILARRAAGQQLSRVMALVGVPLLLGPVLGPVLGGILVDDAGWRWIFLINLPVCLVAAWAAVKAMPAGQVERAVRLDVLGLALLSAALVGIVYGLSRIGSTAGLDTGSAVPPLAAGVVLLAGFVVHALRTAEPIVDLRLFRDRDFAAAAALMFLAMVALLGTLLLLPLYYQQVHGYTPMHAGLLLAPYGVGSMISLVLARRFIDRFGVRPVALTGVLVLLGVVLCLTQLAAGTGQWLLAILICLAGVGFGAVLVPAQMGVYGNLTGAAVPHATTAVRVFQQVGGSFGVAVLAVALQHNAAAAAGTADLGHAFGRTYWWAAAATALALVPVSLLRTPRRPVDPAEPASQSAARSLEAPEPELGR